MKFKFSANLNLTLYSLLLIVTPFLMLMNFLQDAIGKLSNAHFTVFDVKITYLLFIAILGLIFVFIRVRKELTKTRILGLFLMVALTLIGQKIGDYYYNHNFYDLQHNWHYIAYGIFSYVAYRKFFLKNFSPAKIIWRTFLMAFIISLFDEIIQVYISNRVFDLSDVGKDMWGALIGQFFIQFVLLECKHIKPFTYRHQKIKDYITSPSSALFIQAGVSLIFIYISSVLSYPSLWPQVFLISLLAVFFFLLILHMGNTRLLKWIIRGTFGIVVIWLVYANFSGNAYVKYVSENVIVYKGLPFYYFDVMIFPDGGYRVVDKKETFLGRDKLKIDDINPDILIIGTGKGNTGGKGFNDQRLFEFRPNFTHSKLYQIIKLPNKQACLKYNELLSKNKKVLLILYQE